MADGIPNTGEIKDMVRDEVAERLGRTEFDLEFAVVLSATATERPIIGAWGVGKGIGDEDARAHLEPAAAKVRKRHPQAMLG